MLVTQHFGLHYYLLERERKKKKKERRVPSIFFISDSCICVLYTGEAWKKISQRSKNPLRTQKQKRQNEGRQLKLKKKQGQEKRETNNINSSNESITLSLQEFPCSSPVPHNRTNMYAAKPVLLSFRQPLLQLACNFLTKYGII